LLHRPKLPWVREHSAGQALVETALVLPLILILLMGAIDFGQLFFGWSNLHQAVRIGADYAATHPDMDAAERTRFEELIANDVGDINCAVATPIPNPTYTLPNGTPTSNPALGDYANLTLECDFSPITPLGAVLFGSPITMAATSTFPIREGCINCPTPVPATPPPAPAQCRVVPDLDGLSVAGARLAWESAGFFPANFTPQTGADTETVDSFIVTEDDPLSTCSMPTQAVFSSSVTVTTIPVPPCADAIVPNLIGLSLAQAQTTWTGAGFTGALTADGGDPAVPAQDRVVTAQATDPASNPGVDCVDPATLTIDVTTGIPWPPAPPVPCRVPNMINLTRPQGEAAWNDADFTGTFSPGNGNFTIQSQSLVGGTYVECDADVTVSAKAGG
jgi:hypothetical protein